SNAQAKLAELNTARAFAEVGMAVDASVNSMERAMAIYALAPAEKLLDTSELTEGAQALISLIVEADTTEGESTLRFVAYDAQEGEGYAERRLAAAAEILGLESDELHVIIDLARGAATPEEVLTVLEKNNEPLP